MCSILPFQNISDESFNLEINNISVHDFLTGANSKNTDFDIDTENIRPDRYFFSDELSYTFENVDSELTMIH